MIRIETRRSNRSLSRAQKTGLSSVAPVFGEHPSEIAGDGHFYRQSGSISTQFPVLSNPSPHKKPMQNP